MQIFNNAVLKTSDKPIFVVEGEIDAMSIIEVGGEAIAIGSTGNVRMLISLLEVKKPSKPLIIALDNDDAGYNASKTLVDALRTREIPFYVYNPMESLMTLMTLYVRLKTFSQFRCKTANVRRKTCKMTKKWLNLTNTAKTVHFLTYRIL